jgi:hypothetical protein
MPATLVKVSTRADAILPLDPASLFLVLTPDGAGGFYTRKITLQDLASSLLIAAGGQSTIVDTGSTPTLGFSNGVLSYAGA